MDSVVDWRDVMVTQTVIMADELTRFYLREELLASLVVFWLG